MNRIFCSWFVKLSPRIRCQYFSTERRRPWLRTFCESTHCSTKCGIMIEIEDEIQSSLPSGWERAETFNGVPYYINHETETTQWSHPVMTQLMADISGADDIKYAAYRTAVKLRAIQKKIQLYLIDLRTIRAGFNDLGYSESFSEDVINVQQLERILTEIFTYQNDKTDDINVADGVALTLNWLLNVYDQERRGSLRILSAKIGLSCLSVASVQEKYTYMFDQLSSSKGFIDRRRLRVFLKDALQILKYLKEYTPFGRAGVESAVESCFERAYIPERISFREFLDWMIDEPQTVVWLPTLHRLAMAESVKHEGKCNICKIFPIIGFRYRCLKCFNFDLCQSCFWSGRVSKNHKLAHPTQEYCLPATQKEDIKDFAKVIKSKIRKKKNKKRKAQPKTRFLPISNDGTAQASDEENVSDNDYGDSESSTSFEFHTSSERLMGETEKTSKESPPASSGIVRPRPIMDDEHQLISYYASCLNGSPQPTTSTPVQTLATLERNQVAELNEIVENLEKDNRYLRETILDMQDVETRRSLLQTEEKEFVEEHNERLEARQEVLEDHNQRLEDQLRKLRLLIPQKKPTDGIYTSMPRETDFPITNSLMNPPYQSYHPSHLRPTRDDFKSTSPSSTSPENYERFRPSVGISVANELSENWPRRLKQDMTSVHQPSQSQDYPWRTEGQDFFKGHDCIDDVIAGTVDSTSSDDLRAIEAGMEKLLEPELLEGSEELRAPTQCRVGTQEDSDYSSSDEQQEYLLTAASMVGEAVQYFLSSLSQESNSWKYLELDFTNDEAEV